MPKIFVLRDRLAEQQARLRANDKNGVGGAVVNGGAASEDAAAAGPSQQQQQQQPLNLQYAPKIGKRNFKTIFFRHCEEAVNPNRKLDYLQLYYFTLDPILSLICAFESRLSARSVSNSSPAPTHPPPLSSPPS